MFQQSDRQVVCLTQEREGFPGVGYSISEHQTIASLHDVLDQTPDRTLKHLPLTRLWSKHLHTSRRLSDMTMRKHFI